LSSGRILRSTPGGTSVLDEDCRSVDRWQTDSGWGIIAAEPARGSVLLRHSTDAAVSVERRLADDQIAIADYESDRLMAGWPRTIPPSAGVYFRWRVGRSMLFRRSMLESE